jgi:Ca-activated chloride channel family protein
MTFASPELLLGLLLVPAAIGLYLLVQRRRSRYAVRFTNVDLLANIAPKKPAWRRHVPPVLYLVAITALVIGLARPSMVMAVPRNEATIVLAIDVSRSMLATDVQPTRIAAAQKAANDFVDQLPSSFRVGLVAFSTEARIALPPTSDHGAVHAAINDLTANGGTAMGDAIELSLEAAGVAQSGSGTAQGPAASPDPSASGAPGASASPDPSASPAPKEKPLVATVLLSDGANSTGQLEPQQAADLAAAAGVPVYTIALGTADGTVEVPNPFGQMQQLQVPPDTNTLATVAETTGAKFFSAPSAEDLAQIYENLGSKVGYTQQEQEITQLFAGAALLFVLAGAGLAAHWFNRFP